MKERLQAIAANTLLIGGIAIGTEGLVTSDYRAQALGCLVTMGSFPLYERQPERRERRDDDSD